MAYTVTLLARAAREIRDLDAALQQRILTAIGTLATTPRPVGSKRLTGYPHTYRIRVGDYRIVYVIRDQQLLVIVVAVGHRRDIYDALHRIPMPEG
jgi:mRNA interferase RelE/StbE